MIEKVLKEGYCKDISKGSEVQGSPFKVQRFFPIKSGFNIQLLAISNTCQEGVLKLVEI